MDIQIVLKSIRDNGGYTLFITKEDPDLSLLLGCMSLVVNKKFPPMQDQAIHQNLLVAFKYENDSDAWNNFMNKMVWLEDRHPDWKMSEFIASPEQWQAMMSVFPKDHHSLTGDWILLWKDSERIGNARGINEEEFAREFAGLLMEIRRNQEPV